MPPMFESHLMQNLRLLTSYIICVLVLPALSLHAAADSNAYSAAYWEFEDAQAVVATAADITPERFADCDLATVEQRMVRAYRADGTGECQDETFVKVLTEKGKRAERTLSLGYMLPYSRAEVVQLEVLKPDGRVVPVDIAANSKESIDDSQMQMNIYDPNVRVLRVNIPKLEVGDMVHAITRRRIERPFMPGQFAEENVFEDTGYIRHISYEVHAPEARPLRKIALRDEVPGTVTSSVTNDAEGNLEYRWEVNNVPRMFNEPAMPPYEMVLQRLLVSTAPDWQAVSKWYWDLSKPHIDATTPEMREAVDALTADATTDMDKIKALFYEVSKTIRYMGLSPEKDRPGFEPHDVCLTFEKKYGVCRDKEALLVALLREAGLPAYPVLISVGAKQDPEVPDPFFNHAIVGVELEPGHYLLMDPTDENTRELLPYYDCDRSYLVCRPEGEELLTSPIESPDRNLMRVKTTGVLNDNGVLEAKSELFFEGVNDDVYRNAFAKMKPDDKRRFFESNLKRTMPGAQLKSLKLFPENMLDMSTVVRAELEFSVDGMVAGEDGKSVVTVPWIGKRMGVVNFILGDAGLDKRKYPMQTFVPCGLREDVSIRLGDAFLDAVSLPGGEPVADDCVSYREHFDFADHTLDCSRELKLKVVEFSPTQYLALKKTLKELEYDERKTPVMATAVVTPRPQDRTTEASEATAVSSDATILDSRTELDVTDPHNAVYRVKYSKRVLSYNGKKRESELKIPYNPACQQVELIRAAVIAPSGECQEISQDEINFMDASWNASAKRYTGGKILVANLPGVEIGSTIEVEFAITQTNTPYLSAFESFQLSDDLKHKSFLLSAPGDVSIQRLACGEPNLVHETEQNANGRQSFEWQADEVAALPGEPQLPPVWLFDTGVEYFVGDVSAYYEALRRTLLDRSSQSANAAELARKLTAGAQSRLEAATAIRDFIAKSIRPAGPSFAQLPLDELSAADTTLADGYGHMADCAILYHAMLTAAGFHPEFVLASNLPQIERLASVPKAFPIPQLFQAPLVRITVDGETYYFNDTDQYARPGTTPHDGMLGIVLADQSYETIRAGKDCRDRTETAYRLTLGDDGSARIDVTKRFYGTGYNRLNRYFSELPPEQRRRAYQELVSNMAQGAHAESELTTDFGSYPGLEQYSVAVDNYCVVDGNYYYFDLPFTPTLFPPWTDHRTLPLYLSGTRDETVRTEIALPPGFRTPVIVPSSETLTAPDNSGTVRITSATDTDSCIVTHEFETHPAIVDPEDYSGLLEVGASLGEKSARVFLLEKQSAP